MATIVPLLKIGCAFAPSKKIQPNRVSLKQFASQFAAIVVAKVLLPVPDNPPTTRTKGRCQV